MARVAGIQTSSAVWMTALLFVLALLLAPPALAREFQRPIRIGVISNWINTPALTGLREGLEILGYRENIDYVVGVRFTSGDIAGLPRAVRELLGMGADILFANSHWSALAVKNAASTIPLVFISHLDPVKIGLVESFAHPGGNSTGLATLYAALIPKILQTYTRILPGKKRFLFFLNKSNQIELENLQEKFIANLKHAERQLRIDLDIKLVGSREEARRILGSVRRKDVDGLLIPSIILSIFGYSLEASRREKIPIMGSYPLAVERGALASYGPDLHEIGRQAARLMDKIFRGADPGRIPVEVTDRMLLVINLKVAKELGIEIPPEMLFRADRIIR